MLYAIAHSPGYVSFAHPGGSTTLWILAVLLCVYVALTLALIAHVPLNAAPDEEAHVQYVQHLAVTGKLPVFQPLGAPHPGYEYHQPPLYYILCQPLWRMTGPGVQDYGCRLISLLCGALTLLLIWPASRALFPANRSLPILATGFAALWPMHQAVGASTGNDALAGLISAALFFLVARGASRPWMARDCVWLGVLAGLGWLSKTTCLSLTIMAAGAAWSFARRRSVASDEAGAVSPIYAPSIVLGAAMLIGGWWLARNQVLYDDPFALGIFNQAFGKDPSAMLTLAAIAGFVPLGTYLGALLLLLFCTAWGVFGGPETARQSLHLFSRSGVQWPAAPLLMLMLICALATFVALGGLVKWWRSRPDLTAEQRIALAWWLAGLVLVVLGWAQFNLHYFQAQARYFHPALAPLAVGFALGWQTALQGIAKNRILWPASTVLAATMIALTLWNVFGWHTLI